MYGNSKKDALTDLVQDFNTGNNQSQNQESEKPEQNNNGTFRTPSRESVHLGYANIQDKNK